MSQLGPELLGRLFDQHSSALELYTRGWCDCPEDVVQEAFVKLAAQPTMPENPVAWLYRVVRNRAISVRRSSDRRRRHESSASKERPAWFASSPEAPIDADESTAALESLSPEAREVIVAHLWGGLTFEQIAELTGTSSSTAHRRYAAGLNALRERLGVPCPNRDSKNR